MPYFDVGYIVVNLELMLLRPRRKIRFWYTNVSLSAYSADFDTISYRKDVTQVTHTLVFRGSWDDCFIDYDKSYAIVVNKSQMSHNTFTHSLRRYLKGTDIKVVSRKGTIYLNPPVKFAKKIPTVIYYEGNWDAVFDNLRPYPEQQVVNLTQDYKRNCDFVKQLNRALEAREIDNFEAVAVNGRCMLRRV